jgi:arsenite methyltransferase
VGGMHRRGLQENAYREAIESSGLRIDVFQNNPEYEFISDSAQGATTTFGVKSVSILALQPA